METSFEFYKQILDSTSDHIVVIDEAGDIQFVNKQWTNFGLTNDCSIDRDWEGVNYLSECEKAGRMGDEFGLKAAEGIQSIINREQPAFYFEYPCHSPLQKRWFMMHVTQFTLDQKRYFVISHKDITERKIIEEKVSNLATLDGLTNIANRRTFDQFLKLEWRRCLRLKKPITLAMIDLDYFKQLNDRYGHQAGDDCLKLIAELLNRFSNRPGDLAARYGGEEFALVMGDTTLLHARSILAKFLEELSDLKIANEGAPHAGSLTASIGLAEMVPNQQSTLEEIIYTADKMLYKAKNNGRNRMEY